jgi:hypothetical protein
MNPVRVRPVAAYGRGDRRRNELVGGGADGHERISPASSIGSRYTRWPANSRAGICRQWQVAPGHRATVCNTDEETKTRRNIKLRSQDNLN